MKAPGWLGLGPLASLVLLTQGASLSRRGTVAPRSLVTPRLDVSTRTANRTVSALSLTAREQSGKAGALSPKASKRRTAVSLVRENSSASEHPGLESGSPDDLDELIRSAKNEGLSGAAGGPATSLPDASTGNPQDLEELIRSAKSGAGGAGGASAGALAPSSSAAEQPIVAATPEPRRHGDDWQSSQASGADDDFEGGSLGQGGNHADVFPSMTRFEAPTGEQPFMAEPHFEKEPLVQPLEKPQPMGEAHFAPSEVGNIPDDEFLSGLSHGARKRKHREGKSIAFKREEETEKAVAKEMTENYNAWKPGRSRHGKQRARAAVAGRPLEPASEETKHRFSTHNLVEQIESEAATAEADHIEVRYREPPRVDASAPNATGEPKFFPPTQQSALHANSAAPRGPAQLGGQPPAKAPSAPASTMFKSGVVQQVRCLAWAVALVVVALPFLGIP